MTTQLPPSSEPHWAIAYQSNGLGSCRRWYRVTRLIYADGHWYELYWHPNNVTMSGKSLAETRHKARALGLDLLPGIYRNCYSPLSGNTMERV